VFHAALTCAVEGDADDDADGEIQRDAAILAFRFLLRLRARLPECLGACLAVAREGVVSHSGAANAVGFFIGYLMTLSSWPQCVDAVVEHMDLLWLALNLNPEWSAMDRVDMAVCCMKTLHNVAGARRQLPRLVPFVRLVQGVVVTPGQEQRYDTVSHGVQFLQLLSGAEAGLPAECQVCGDGWCVLSCV
jgi:hypothetical protein